MERKTWPPGRRRRAALTGQTESAFMVSAGWFQGSDSINI